MMKMIKLDKEECNLKIFNYLKLKKNKYIYTYIFNIEIKRIINTLRIR